MEWLDALLKKLPTLKGITAFFYVAAHWGTISQDFEELRRQIHARDEWMKTQEQTLTKLHQIEVKKINAEYSTQLDSWRSSFEKLLDRYSDAVFRLALFYHFNPLHWAVDSPSIDSALRKNIESVISQLPPLPSTPPAPLNLAELRLSDIFGQPTAVSGPPAPPTFQSPTTKNP